MAKSQLRGNREAKKPKQPKKILSPAGEGAWPTPAKTSVSGKPAKKK
ncbi:hypothetical protein [Paraburkholderia dinghuensis]|nr:hypothetical protein [Paraburkholderia dinghuensis]